MDLIRFYQDHNIDHLTHGHKHCRPGWVNAPCPFCSGNPGYHLGFELERQFFRCWRCGWHPILPTLHKLTGIPLQDLRSLLRQYGDRPHIQKPPQTVILRPRAKAFRLPSDIGKLNTRHRQYLSNRKFDPERLEQEWGLVGTGPASMLDGREYKHRIIAPIPWEGRVVSFQGRDITDRHKLKYKACPKDRELIHHKEILYGAPDYWEDVGVAVEGITDVWRLGPQAFALFGIDYKRSQMQAIAKAFRRVVVIFDDEPQAQRRARELAGELRFRGVEAVVEVIQGDPGGMAQDDADHLMRQVIGKLYAGY